MSQVLASALAPTEVPGTSQVAAEAWSQRLPSKWFRYKCHQKQRHRPRGGLFLIYHLFRAYDIRSTRSSHWTASALAQASMTSLKAAEARGSSCLKSHSAPRDITSTNTSLGPASALAPSPGACDTTGACRSQGPASALAPREPPMISQTSAEARGQLLP